jgi:hypothetical protein
MDHVKRREFMGLLASAAATWPLVTFAQSPEHMRRIGVVMAYAEDDPNGQIQVEAFRETLATLGWLERRNVTIDVRYARGNPARAGIGYRVAPAEFFRHELTASLRSESQDARRQARATGSISPTSSSP